MTTQTTSSAEFTDHLAVAVAPEMKERAEAAGKKRGVNKSVIVRWALAEWLENHEGEG